MGEDSRGAGGDEGEGPHQEDDDPGLESRHPGAEGEDDGQVAVYADGHQGVRGHEHCHALPGKE